MRLMMTWVMMLSQRDDRMNPLSVTKPSMKRQNEIRAKAELAAEKPA
jgi:hypothetical protein